VNLLAKMNKTPASAVVEPLDAVLDQNVPDQLFEAEDSYLTDSVDIFDEELENPVETLFEAEESPLHHANAFDVENSPLIFETESTAIDFTHDSSPTVEQEYSTGQHLTQNSPISQTDKQESPLVFTQGTSLDINTPLAFVDDSEPQESILVNWEEENEAEEDFVTGNSSWIQEDSPLPGLDDFLSLFQAGSEVGDEVVPSILLSVYILTGLYIDLKRRR
jgi:hypothetical protein